MALETTLTPAASTRRALLAGSLGALVAYVAHALGRPLSARATDGDVIHVGDELSASSVTKITNTANNETVIEAVGLGGGVIGRGSSEGYYGVLGSNGSGDGVGGISAAGTGVFGSSSDGVGVHGISFSGPGVQGSSTDNIGVHGDSAAGTGVYGAGERSGVFGESTSGVGVSGRSLNGTGMRAEAAGGTALRVDGKATFSRSGRLTLAAGQSSIAKTGLPLSRYSLVLAVLQTNRAGIYVRAVVPSPSTSSFRVYLNAAVPGTTNVAWFVLN
jgi:hypothetical protein